MIRYSDLSFAKYTSQRISYSFCFPAVLAIYTLAIVDNFKLFCIQGQTIL